MTRTKEWLKRCDTHQNAITILSAAYDQAYERLHHEGLHQELAVALGTLSRAMSHVLRAHVADMNKLWKEQHNG